MTGPRLLGWLPAGPCPTTGLTHVVPIHISGTHTGARCDAALPPDTPLASCTCHQAGRDR